MAEEDSCAPGLVDFPDEKAQLESAFQAFVAAMHNPLYSSEEQRRLRRMLIASPYARRLLEQHPVLLNQLAAAPTPFVWQPEISEDKFLAALRRHRQARMLQIIWQDLRGPGAVDETVQSLSELAEESLSAALDYGQQLLHKRHGSPRDESGAVVPFVVFGMGKLGGQELNLSSDIDLLFVYGASGESDGPMPLDNPSYFQRLGQWLIRALSELRAEGFVFRVDMRLRPFGDAGPLCVTADALEQYYHRHGRSWERYALLKARPVAGDLAFAEEVWQRLQPFLYRRYLDFTALAGLRRVKALMDAEQGQASQDIKKGLGGIREIEFIVQSLQLIHGGRLPALRERNTLRSLDQIATAGLLSNGVIATLQHYYRLWRRVEHALQMVEDRQTQTLPSDNLAWLRLACALDAADPEMLQKEIEDGRAQVHEIFLQTLPVPATSAENDAAQIAWLAARNAIEDSIPDAWGQLVPNAHEDCWLALRHFARNRRVLQLSQRGQARLDTLVPGILRRLANASAPATLLNNYLRLLDALLGQAQYLALLAENPHWLGRLEDYLESPWLTQELIRFPSLLEDVLCGRSAAARDWPQLFSEKEDRERDLEERMDLLRRFKNTEMLLMASAFWTAKQDVAKLLPELSDLAGFCLQRALPWAIEAMLQQHGALPGYANPPFAVIAYGKLGGREMGLASDLDLVFLYDAPPELESSGRIPLSAAAWFARLGQKLIHILSVLTRAGTLYEIDMRLRPSGQSGPLVSSLTAFRKYQRESAWTWEHQALTRARFLAGDTKLGQQFAELRQEILCRPRDRADLAQEIRSMRQRIAREKPVPKEQFHLKLSPGALLDIEFLVQFAILSFSADNPDLLRVPSTHEALLTLGELGLWEQSAVAELEGAWLALRDAENRCWLRLQAPALEQDDPQFAAVQNTALQVQEWTTRLGLAPLEE
ncbi:bifunctional [glutamate--ammonia ligase]-adenylyl-L-tyrosine phosphorylase/[glutamate--ammonia-ligase] adenylyltransferase [Acidithiobacillus sp. IBUN Pt1247-S3]|uniref:bifunctional [glutamate--ammonia ligase]-adenylyl-L-tyrosine phosphorylase/[glutamate--ammonia-ligase] adenylyltransferase n=1 Tax=Acidithiobacillus sp. IBUN Pt1247-S3 TaxID=3166642 RepID=UPI0034E41725